jgi:hypothetical protein
VWSCATKIDEAKMSGQKLQADKLRRCEKRAGKGGALAIGIDRSVRRL